MALSWSEGLRNFIGQHGSYQRALNGGILELRTGSAPATANAAATGTLLCTVSLASGTVTKETLAKGCIILTGGAAGSVDSITINGVEILGAVVAFNGTLAQTAADVASQINKYVSPSGIKYIATASGTCVTISAVPGTGATPNAYPMTAGFTTITATTSGFGTVGTAGTGINGSAGLTFGEIASGVLSKSGVWSGVNVATGVAGYFRILGSVNDAGAASTSLIRVQGACGIASGDYPMTTTTLTSGQTHTIDAFSLTLPAA